MKSYLVWTVLYMNLQPCLCNSLHCNSSSYMQCGEPPPPHAVLVSHNVYSKKQSKKLRQSGYNL